MTSSHSIYISPSEDGGFLAVSKRAPKFCVSAATLDEVRAKAAHAYAHYREVIGKPSLTPTFSTTVVTLPFQREDLAAA